MLHDRDITVELRSVNHRCLDVNVKAPRMWYGFLEEAVKTAVAGDDCPRQRMYVTIDASIR